MNTHLPATILGVALCSALLGAPQGSAPVSQPSLPRTADGKPNFAGIWEASSTAYADLQDHVAGLNMLAGRSVVAGGEIPYQPWAAAKKAENFRDRQTADPLNRCYLPSVPRIMYLQYPFQIFQTPQAVAITFEWSLVYRLIRTDGSPHPNVETWMGDSRGHWEGDTLVVNVAKYNDKTWFDMAGDFHSNALHVTERFRMTDPDTIQYEATIEDPKVFTKAWTISLPLKRRTDRTRLFEYPCQAEIEETNGLFTREDRTWYPGNGTPVPAMAMPAPHTPPAPADSVANIRRTAGDKPDFQGFWESDTGAANQGLEKRARDSIVPAGRGIIVDPPDGKLPMQPWAVQERTSRNLPERGYDDPTAHCFPAGVPRSMYIPSAMHIIQTPDYIVFLHERMWWRIVPIVKNFDGRQHLPDNIRLWEGDSIGRWDGDTLVIDTTNLNGRTWLNEGGEIVSYAEHVVERYTPAGSNTINYEATIVDPLVYTRPWTIAFPVRHKNAEIYEYACHEEDHDLPHLKALKDAAAKKK